MTEQFGEAGAGKDALHVGEHPFSDSYAEARERFLKAAHAAGAKVTEYRNPASGPSGETLHASVARFGAKDAKRGIVTISGTHGVEGYCGAACQLHWLENGFGGDLPPNFAVIHIHAINPFGFAAVSRVDEVNIDINRNFLTDWRQLPENAGYETLAAALRPDGWSAGNRERTSHTLDDYREQHGRAAWQAAVMGGQYSDAEGLFYGGRAPCWSNRTFHSIVAEHLTGFDDLTAIDLHTGLGAYGAMEVMVISPPSTAGYRRVQGWFEGRATSPFASTSNAQLVKGPLLAALPDLIPDTDVALIAVEFGTSDTSVVVDALRADNWVRRYATPSDPDWQSVKRDMRRHFCPQDAEWQDQVIAHATMFAGTVTEGMGRAS